MSQYSTSVIENLYPLGTQYTNLLVYLLTCFQIIKIYQNIGGEVCEVCYPLKLIDLLVPDPNWPLQLLVPRKPFSTSLSLTLIAGKYWHPRLIGTPL